MNEYDLKSSQLTLNLEQGMAWALYADDGPGGPCGQSSDITCPHSVFHIWPNVDAMNKDLEASSTIGRNKKYRLMCGVIGDWSSGGRFKIKMH